MRHLQKTLNQHRSAGKSAFRHGTQTTTQLGPRRRLHLAELNADLILQPIHCRRNFFGVGHRQRRIGTTGRHLHHVFEKSVLRIFDAAFLLPLRTPSIHGTQRIDGVPVRTIRLFNDADLGSGIMSCNGADQTSHTGAHNHHIPFLVLLLIVCHSRHRHQRTCGRSGTNTGCAQKSATRKHHRSPYSVWDLSSVEAEGTSQYFARFR